MLDNVTGNVGVHLAVGATASLLCILLVMGLKLKWFRARMTFEQPDAQQEAPSVGVYRSKFFSDFDSPSTSSLAPLSPSPKPPPHPPSQPPPPPQRTPKTPTSGPSKPNLQADAKEDKSKKIKETKPKVPKEKEVKTKPPKAAKVKAPKLPSDLKSELLKATETKTKTKPVKGMAPQGMGVTTTMSNPADKVKVTKERKHKSKSKDNTGKQLSNGVDKAGNNTLTLAEEEVVSTSNAFLMVRPTTKTLAQPQTQGEENNGVLSYSQDSFERGQNRVMKTFGSMMPTKTQVDLSVSPIPQYDPANNPRVLRNPIASGVRSYQPPRDGKETGASVYVNMNGQSKTSDRPLFLDLEDESET